MLYFRIIVHFPFNFKPYRRRCNPASFKISNSIGRVCSEKGYVSNGDVQRELDAKNNNNNNNKTTGYCDVYQNCVH